VPVSRYVGNSRSRLLKHTVGEDANSSPMLFASRIMSRLFIMPRGIFFAGVLAMLASSSYAQSVGSFGGKHITGQIRIEGHTAPQGVLVLLDRARGRDASFVSGSGELGNTMTDSRGKFNFDNIDGGQEQPEGKVYVVTIRYPGYRSATQVVDLTASPFGMVNVDLKRDTSKDVPNVPGRGMGSTISAKQPSSSKAQEELARGEELLIEKRDPKASIKNFKKLVELDPQYGPGYVLLGTAHMQLQEWGDAKSAFEKATKIEPANASAFLGIGAAMNQQQDFSGAQKPLLRCLELNANSAEAHYELGRSLWALGKWQEAEPHAHKAITINKDFAPSHVLMGNIYLRHRDAKSALSEFQEYLRLDPQGEHAEPVKQMVDRIQKALGQR
jgi:tetratricopeptide (TPR) repeat protein